MTQQDPVTSDRLTDHVAIGLLATAFPEAAVHEVLDATGRRQVRDRALPAHLMVYLTMAMWLEFGKGYEQVLRFLLAGLCWARGGWRDHTIPTGGAISRARERLGPEPLRLLFERTVEPTAADDRPEALWRGLRRVAVDCTVFDLPASEGNTAAFATPGGGVPPRARLVALAECGSLALLGAAFDSTDADEDTLFAGLLDRLGPDMVVLAGRGLASYELYTAAAGTGAQLAWRVPGSFALPVLRRLEDGTYLSQLCGEGRGERVTVRVVEYSVTDDDGTSEVFALVTTLHDPRAAPAMELVRLHVDRWRVETLFRLVRADLRVPGGVLRSRTAQGARQELWALLCLYQALRPLTAHAAVIDGVDPDRVRFRPLADAVEDSDQTAFSP
ncbi:IS4 family transposase [Nocardiopsis sp. NPDC058631]|uniref:IS4 family transposase n=1 Tax=Nocardiopsis sp. NPDC058631 TaxID=3346566 RepID=UPI00365DD122